MHTRSVVVSLSALLLLTLMVSCVVAQEEGFDPEMYYPPDAVLYFAGSGVDESTNGKLVAIPPMGGDVEVPMPPEGQIPGLRYLVGVWEQSPGPNAEWHIDGPVGVELWFKGSANSVMLSVNIYNGQQQLAALSIGPTNINGITQLSGQGMVSTTVPSGGHIRVAMYYNVLATQVNPEATLIYGEDHPSLLSIPSEAVVLTDANATGDEAVYISGSISSPLEGFIDLTDTADVPLSGAVYKELTLTDGRIDLVEVVDASIELSSLEPETGEFKFRWDALADVPDDIPMRNYTFFVLIHDMNDNLWAGSVPFTFEPVMTASFSPLMFNIVMVIAIVFSVFSLSRRGLINGSGGFRMVIGAATLLGARLRRR